ncbi:hypothetical protein AB0F88_40300 [Streptosporangium sp. NPDC023963]|uniref:hypothetical protein n=1 Tax=Streptosporangium sp. NPDC023963 TaxID=3155608 RepID=UPI003439ED46
MPDYEFPPDLLDAQRAYSEADRRVQEVTDALPTAQEVMEGAITDEQRAELVEAREARLTALEALNRHPWWEQPEQRDRYAAWKALQAAATARQEDAKD